MAAATRAYELQVTTRARKVGGDVPSPPNPPSIFKARLP
jgi:hypothetical protein